MKIKENNLLAGVSALLFFCIAWLFLPMERANASDLTIPRLQQTDKLVIVIDPGHGGTNEGTTENGFLEKEMTLVTAKAMYEELIQYDNVEVYMTRTDDSPMSLEQRAEFAAAVEADFLYSIHYNASAGHTLYGSEVWISSKPPFNAYGYQFGYCQMQKMQEMGLFLRGIKTKLKDNGLDYYGIIRECTALNIPSAIIEHCHVDEERDSVFCETTEQWEEFGRADAQAVAMYFGLSSTALNTDYHETAMQLPYADENHIAESTVRDTTAPEICMAELLQADYQTGEISLQVTAADYDSQLLYYDYSLDGGETFCSLQPWPDTDIFTGTYTDTFTLNLLLEDGVMPQIIVRAYNLADLYTESQVLYLQTIHYPEPAPSEETSSSAADIPSHDRERPTAGTTTFIPAGAAVNEENTKGQTDIFVFLKICIAVICFILISVLLIQHSLYQRRRRKRRQRRNVVGEKKYQPK